MNGFTLSPAQIQELRLAHRLTKDKRAAYRLNVICLLGTGWTQEAVSEALLLDEGTLRHYVKRYREGGIKGLINDHYVGGQTKLYPEELEQLDEHLLETLYLDAKSVAGYIKKRFGVSYGIRGVTERLCRKNNWTRQTQKILGEFTPQAHKVVQK